MLEVHLLYIAKNAVVEILVIYLWNWRSFGVGNKVQYLYGKSDSVLIIKIKKTEGYECGFLDLNDMLEYQERIQWCFIWTSIQFG